MGLGWSQAKPTGMLRRRWSKIFMENVNKTRQTRPCSFFFSELGCCPYDFNSRKLAYITGRSTLTSYSKINGQG